MLRKTWGAVVKVGDYCRERVQHLGGVRNLGPLRSLKMVSVGEAQRMGERWEMRAEGDKGLGSKSGPC